MQDEARRALEAVVDATRSGGSEGLTLPSWWPDVSDAPDDVDLPPRHIPSSVLGGHFIDGLCEQLKHLLAVCFRKGFGLAQRF